MVRGLSNPFRVAKRNAILSFSVIHCVFAHVLVMLGFRTVDGAPPEGIDVSSLEHFVFAEMSCGKHVERTPICKAHPPSRKMRQLNSTT